jgi:GAF domain-containing protein
MDTDTAVEAFLEALRHPASRGSVAASAEVPLLRSVVDAAVMLFGAEAASIALYEPDPERLEFRVAAGQQGAGVVGLAVPPSKGVVGYVFSTGQSIALSDVASDPRFDRATAERTGYVPRSIAAVPLSGDGTTLGVLQVLDKRGSATFSLEDMSMLETFARQASLALQASRVARDSARLLRRMLVRPDDETGPQRGLDARLTAVATALDAEDEPPFWRTVDRLTRLRDLPDRDLALVADLLGLIAGPETTQGSLRRRHR